MGDAHLFVGAPDGRAVLEMYRARILPGRFILARRAFRVDLTGLGMFLRDGRFPGVRAMDASGMGGLLRAWELRAGRINHALTFLLPPGRLRHGPVWPSAREDFWGVPRLQRQHPHRHADRDPARRKPGAARAVSAWPGAGARAARLRRLLRTIVWEPMASCSPPKAPRSPCRNSPPCARTSRGSARCCAWC